MWKGTKRQQGENVSSKFEIVDKKHGAVRKSPSVWSKY